MTIRTAWAFRCARLRYRSAAATAVPPPRARSEACTSADGASCSAITARREATDAVLQNGWLYTGDAALLDENGLLYIKGREDDMINKAGMNIYPQELESALLADPRVREVRPTASARRQACRSA